MNNITHTYKIPSTLDINALDAEMDALQKVRTSVREIKDRLEKYSNILSDIHCAAKNVRNYASDCQDATEDGRRPSPETLATFYGKVAELKVLSSEYSDLIATFADDVVSSEVLFELQTLMMDSVYKVNNLPFEKVDNTQS